MAQSKAKSTAKKASTKKSVAAKTKSAPTATKKVDKVAAAEVSAAKDKKATRFNTAIRPGALIAEFLGTFMLAGAVMAVAGDKMMVMFALIAIVVVFGVISGAHLNPAITIAVCANRKMKWLNGLFYIVAQVLGALLAYFVLRALFEARLEDLIVAKLETQYGPTLKDQLIQSAGSVKAAIEAQWGSMADAAKALNVTLFHASLLSSGAYWTAFLAELLGSVVFGLGVGYAVLTTKKGALATGFAVGGSLFLGLAIGGSTVILNPAVAAALGVFNTWSPFSVWAWHFLVYAIATTIGMTVGFTLYRMLLKDKVVAE